MAQPNGSASVCYCALAVSQNTIGARLEKYSVARYEGAPQRSLRPRYSRRHTKAGLRVGSERCLQAKTNTFGIDESSLVIRIWVVDRAPNAGGSKQG